MSAAAAGRPLRRATAYALFALPAASCRRTAASASPARSYSAAASASCPCSSFAAANCSTRIVSRRAPRPPLPSRRGAHLQQEPAVAHAGHERRGARVRLGLEVQRGGALAVAGSLVELARLQRGAEAAAGRQQVGALEHGGLGAARKRELHARAHVACAHQAAREARLAAPDERVVARLRACERILQRAALLACMRCTLLLAGWRPHALHLACSRRRAFSSPRTSVYEYHALQAQRPQVTRTHTDATGTILSWISHSCAGRIANAARMIFSTGLSATASKQLC